MVVNFGNSRQERRLKMNVSFGSRENYFGWNKLVVVAVVGQSHCLLITKLGTV